MLTIANSVLISYDPLRPKWQIKGSPYVSCFCALVWRFVLYTIRVKGKVSNHEIMLLHGVFPVEAKNILRLEEVVYNWEPPLDFYNLAWKKKMKTHQFEFLCEALLISQCSEAWPFTNNLVFQA